MGLLLHLAGSVSGPLLVVHLSNSFELELELHDLFVGLGDLLLDVSDLTPCHQLGTLCSDASSSKRRFERRSCVWVVSLLVDLASKVVLLHLEMVNLLDERNVFLQDPLGFFRVID